MRDAHQLKFYYIHPIQENIDEYEGYAKGTTI